MPMLPALAVSSATTVASGLIRLLMQVMAVQNIMSNFPCMHQQNLELKHAASEACTSGPVLLSTWSVPTPEYSWHMSVLCHASQDNICHGLLPYMDWVAHVAQATALRLCRWCECCCSKSYCRPQAKRRTDQGRCVCIQQRQAQQQAS